MNQFLSAGSVANDIVSAATETVPRKFTQMNFPDFCTSLGFCATKFAGAINFAYK